MIKKTINGLLSHQYMNLVQMYLANISGFLSIMRLNYRRKRNQRELCCFFEVIITVSIKVSSNDNSSTSLFVERFNFKPAT